MTVAELIAHLETLPASAPVKVKTYGCGYDHWTDVSSMMIQVVGDNRDRFVEITADWN